MEVPQVTKLPFFKIPWCIRPVVCPRRLQLTVITVILYGSSFILPISEALGLIPNHLLLSIILLGPLGYIHTFNFEIRISIIYHCVGSIILNFFQTIYKGFPFVQCREHWRKSLYITLTITSNFNLSFSLPGVLNQKKLSLQYTMPDTLILLLKLLRANGIQLYYLVNFLSEF